MRLTNKQSQRGIIVLFVFVGMAMQGSSSPNRVLLICPAAIGQRLSGPGVRYWEFARALSAYPDLQVTLATTPGITAQVPESGLAIRLRVTRDEADLRSLAAQSDVIVAVGPVHSLAVGRVAAFAATVAGRTVLVF
jgi:hypothetical protein